MSEQLPRIVWIWSVFGWVPIVGEPKQEQPDLTMAEKKKCLYFFARLFGMPKEQAQYASYFELHEYVDAHMGNHEDND